MSNQSTPPSNKPLKDKEVITTSSLEESGELVPSSEWDDSFNPYGKFRGSTTVCYFEKGTQVILKNEKDKVVESKFYPFEEQKDGNEKKESKGRRATTNKRR